MSGTHGGCITLALSRLISLPARTEELIIRPEWTFVYDQFLP